MLICNEAVVGKRISDITDVPEVRIYSVHDD